MNSNKLNDVPEVKHGKSYSFFATSSSSNTRKNFKNQRIMDLIFPHVDVDAYVKDRSEEEFDDEMRDISYYLNSDSDNDETNDELTQLKTQLDLFRAFLPFYRWYLTNKNIF